MTRKEKKEELIGLYAVGAIYIGDLIDECIEYGQQQPHWISVEEELPKEDGIYLFYDETSGVYTSAYYVGFALPGLITHWMPMPQPPILSKSENIGKKGGEQIIGTADHIKIALGVIDKKGGEQ